MKRIIVSMFCLLTAACGSGSSSTSPATASRVMSLAGSLSFGNVPVGTAVNQSFTITNTGSSVLTIASVSPPCATMMKASFMSGPIGPGATQTVVLTFSPTTALNCSGVVTVYGDETSGTNLINMAAAGTFVGVPLFTMSGVGNSVFTLPSYVATVRIDATFGGACQNFVVDLSTQLLALVNVIIGTCSVATSPSPFTGTYATVGGGQISIINSAGVSWTFTEVR